jgi:hypothetical protein
MPTTITFYEPNNGWTSEWNYQPHAMCNVDNRFYSIKDGNLYLHHDEDNPIPNTFYGVKTPSKIVFYFNDDPTNDKIFKTLEIEGTHAWETLVKTNLTQGDVHQGEYVKKESRFYAYIRKNNVGQIFFGIGTQGIGTIQSISGNQITFNYLPEFTNIGDLLYQDQNTLIGTISAINFNTNTITVTTLTNTPVINEFCFTHKPERIEGAEIRGYYMEVEMTNNDDEKIEMFAVNSNAIKSYV